MMDVSKLPKLVFMYSARHSDGKQSRTQEQTHWKENLLPQQCSAESAQPKICSLSYSAFAAIGLALVSNMDALPSL